MGTYDTVTMNQQQIDRSTQFRIDFSDMESKINLTVNAGRLRSMALTKLEEAAMLLNKAIAHDGVVNSSDGA